VVCGVLGCSTQVAVVEESSTVLPGIAVGVARLGPCAACKQAYREGLGVGWSSRLRAVHPGVSPSHFPPATPPRQPHLAFKRVWLGSRFSAATPLSPLAAGPPSWLPFLLPLLQAAVRWEAERALEPLRRLPQLVAQAMPVTPEVLGPDRSLTVRASL
jgi:hypothetical protein